MGGFEPTRELNPLERLKGVAGKAGWFEVRQHINTGLIKGPCLLSEVNQKHALDAVVQWKDKKIRAPFC